MAYESLHVSFETACFSFLIYPSVHLSFLMLFSPSLLNFVSVFLHSFCFIWISPCFWFLTKFFVCLHECISWVIWSHSYISNPYKLFAVIYLLFTYPWIVSLNIWHCFLMRDAVFEFVQTSFSPQSTLQLIIEA